MKLTAAFLLTAPIASLHAAEAFKLYLAQDIDYPPYAIASSTGEPTGFGAELAKGVDKLCPDIEIVIEKTKWEECWSSANGGQLGNALEDGTFDACMTYTHTQGIRNDFADFSYAILKDNKAAGLMTMLDENGKPTVTGDEDLSGRTIVDVGGWAPTADGLGFVENKCTRMPYGDDYTLVTGDGNDESMMMLRNGTADAMFVYSDQAQSYQCEDGVPAAWNCSLWEGFGTEYAYVQTGQLGHVVNGTTLAMTKKGSGVADMLNPCIQEFLETPEYYELCVKYGLVDSCFPNSHFPGLGGEEVKVYDLETDELETECSDGYCKCPSVDGSGGYGYGYGDK